MFGLKVGDEIIVDYGKCGCTGNDCMCNSCPISTIGTILKLEENKALVETADYGTCWYSLDKLKKLH